MKKGESRGSLEAVAPNVGRRSGAKTWLMSCLSMVLLVVQGTLMSVILRYSRIHGEGDKEGGSVYLPSVSVGIAEGIKLAICITYMTMMGDPQEGGSEGDDLVKTVNGKEHASQGRLSAQQWMMIVRDSVPMALPASMFVFQQVLLIWSATYLDAVTYQIFTQAFKLIPTAVFARLLLGQRLRPMQWASIPVLALGVIFITSNSSAAAGSSSKNSLDSMYFLAMAACSISGLSSAYAGVYFEKYVKGRLAGSLVKRNFQLGLYGVPFSWLYALLKDGRRIREYGVLYGFGASAWGVVCLQVFGGFIIALVVKYCDNILKNFALAGSVIMTVLVSIPLFGQWPSSLFLVGVSIVLSSIFMYGGSFPNIAIPSSRVCVVVSGICVALGTMYMIRGSEYRGWSTLEVAQPDT